MINIHLLDNRAVNGENYLMRVIHKNTGIVSGSNIADATTFWQKLRGYMFYSVPPATFDDCISQL